MRMLVTIFVLALTSGCVGASKQVLPSYTVAPLKASLEYPKYSVKSEKYHLERMVGKGLSGLYLIKETYESSFVAGIEGNKGRVSLELMKIDQKTGKKSKPIWTISESANLWKFKGGYIVLIHRGCCGAPDKNMYFDISTGKQVKLIESESKRMIRSEPVYVFPG